MAVTRAEAEAVLGADLLAKLCLLPPEVRGELIGGANVLLDLVTAADSSRQAEGLDPPEGAGKAGVA